MSIIYLEQDCYLVLVNWTWVLFKKKRITIKVLMNLFKEKHTPD